MLKLYPRGNSISYIVALLFPLSALPALAQPVITSISPASGPINTTVTITGNNFSSTAAANIVWFGSVRVPVTAASSARTDVHSGSGPQFICNADLDGDGKPDMIVANGDSNTVTIYHNNSTPGSVSFSEVASFTMGTNGYPIGVAAGDLDGDGKPDLVISNYYSQTLTVY